MTLELFTKTCMNSLSRQLGDMIVLNNYLVIAVAAVLIFPCVPLCQSAASTPTFELADVQVTPPDAPSRGGGVMSGGRFEVRGETLLALISRAYGIPDDRIQGGPVWLDTDRFDIFANAAPSHLASSLRPMLQTLLADRFKLVTHRESIPLPVWALVLGRHPLLKESTQTGEGGCQETTVNADRVLTCRQVRMANFASKLAELAISDVDRPLVDATGLKSGYDFSLHWTPRNPTLPAGASGSGAPSATPLFEALDKQLGLKIEDQRQPMPALVVDHVNRVPADIGSGSLSFPKVFEVAEIRASAPQVTPSANITGDRFMYYGISLKQMLQVAYNVGEQRIAGGPDWVNTERFDTIAKASVQVPSEVIRVMFRTLIMERFKLTFHMEDRPVPVFALSISKDVSKLKRANTSARSQCRLSNAGAGRIYTCQNTTMQQLAQKLRLVSNAISLPVVDVTGLTGAYDFVVIFDPASRITMDENSTPPNSAIPVASTPSGYLPFLQAMERQTGLQLKKQSHPMPVMVLDHAERPQARN
jgi:uncharacterized protein (TIGR03435 family)